MSSDINPEHFLFRKTPPAWHPYLKLTRLDRPIGVWLLLLPCWWGIVLAHGGVFNVPRESWMIMGWVALGALIMRSAGCVVNDLWDRQLDAGVERTKTRPLASGEISVSHAIRLLAVLLTLSLFILVQLNWLAILLGVLSLALVVAYPKMKKMIWWPQLFLGLTFNWGALLGWAAATDQLAWPSLLLYTGGIFWTLAYDTIYAHQDQNDDARVGIKSTARLFAEKSPQYIATFYGLSLLLLITAKVISSPGILTPLLASLPITLIVWLMRKWDMNDPQSCLAAFKANQYYGWLVLLMLAI